MAATQAFIAYHIDNELLPNDHFIERPVNDIWVLINEIDSTITPPKSAKQPSFFKRIVKRIQRAVTV